MRCSHGRGGSLSPVPLYEHTHAHTNVVMCTTLLCLLVNAWSSRARGIRPFPSWMPAMVGFGNSGVECSLQEPVGLSGLCMRVCVVVVSCFHTPAFCFPLGTGQGWSGCSLTRDSYRHSSVSLRVMREQCQGKSSCAVDVRNDVFGDVHWGYVYVQTPKIRVSTRVGIPLSVVLCFFLS